MNQTQRPSRKAESYTFGVELELLLPQTAIDELGIRIGSYHNGHPLPAPFPQACPERSERGWTAERDASLHTSRPDYVPVEIVSPVLRGRAGIEQVKQVAQTLKGLGARPNVSTGMHCHLGAASIAGPDHADIAEWVGKLLYQVSMHETAIYASTGTHRRENGHYARSIKWQKQAAERVRRAPKDRKPEAAREAAGSGRYHSLNLTNLFTSKATAELRAFAGTVEPTKIVGHICMCLALAERATETTRMDWEAVASEKTYATRGRGLRELNRFFYLAGWVKGRRQVGRPEVEMAGWIADLADLKPVVKELRRLAKQYDKRTV